MEGLPYKCSVVRQVGFAVLLTSKLTHHHSKSHANGLNLNNSDEGRWLQLLTVKSLKFSHQIDSGSLMCTTTLPNLMTIGQTIADK